MSYELHKKPHKCFRHQRIECHICFKRKEIKRRIYVSWTLTVVMEAMSKEPWKPRINVGVCISSFLHSPRHAQSKWLLSWPVLSSGDTLTAPRNLASTLRFHYSCKRSLFFYLSAPLPSVLPLSPLPSPSLLIPVWLLWLTIWFSLVPPSPPSVVPGPLLFTSLCLKKLICSRIWWFTSVILALGRCSQEDREFKIILYSYTL